VRGQAMDSAATRRIRLPRVGSDLHAPVVGEGRAGSRLPPLAEAGRSPRLPLRSVAEAAVRQGYSSAGHRGGGRRSGGA
jgi:hypothetical protein